MSLLRTIAISTVGLVLSATALAAGEVEESGGDLRMDDVLAQVETGERRASSAALAASRSATPARVRPMQVRGDAPVTAGTAFNPAISVILDTVYSRQFSGEFVEPAGFGGGDHGHDHGDGHDHGHGIEDGFQVREVEVVFSGSIDPYFSLLVQSVLFRDGIELEEAYFTTTSLPAGLQVKGGKFLSDIGYINRQHTHEWDFTDQPLVSEVMFGDEGLNELGAQLSWVAPIRDYVRLGVEVLEGDNPGVARGSGDGESVGLHDSSSPRLFTFFAKYGPDLGFDHGLLVGLSGGFSDAWRDVDADHGEALDGDAWFLGADLVYKYDAGGSMGHGNWTFQGEYFYRERDVDFIQGGVSQASGKFRQDGLYAQLLYGFWPRWNVGARFDAVGMTNDTFFEGLRERSGTTYRYTAQVSFLPTEFSRLRLQLSRTDPGDEPHGDHIDSFDSFWRADLQFTFSLGVHGAHTF